MTEYRIRILSPEKAKEIYATKAELISAVNGAAAGGGVGIWGGIIGNIEDQTDLNTILQGKQNLLQAGAGIVIDYTNPAYPIIAAEAGAAGGTWGSIVGTLSDQVDLKTELDKKQYKFTPGLGIVIDETDPLVPVISVGINEVTEEVAQW